MVVRRPYADASALVKLVVREPESDALRGYLMGRLDPATSRIAVVEVQRAIGRATEQVDADALQAVWDRTLMIELDEAVASRAAALEPRSLRSLDAVHLASALALGDEIDAFVTYDSRLADAARGAGLTVLSPA